MGDGECLKKNLDELGYDATSLLSCMTLDVENLHSVVHHKSGVSTALQYIRDCGSTAKESLKQTTAWSAYYYTSRGLWYPVPERSLAMFEIPSMSQTSVVKASKDEISVMREWARAHGSSVRQRSYHGKGWNSARLFVPKGNRSWRKNRPFFKQCGNHRHQLSIQHHWCRRRKLPCTIQVVMKKFVKLKILWRRVLGTSDLRNQQITQDVNSLVGVTSRFGRPVRVNSRFVL